MEYSDDIELAIRYKAKAALRKKARALRAAIPREAAIDRSKAICATLEPLLIEAKRVALFCAIEGKNEVDLISLDTFLRQHGVVVGYPWIHSETRDMIFRATKSTDELEEKGFGFREPVASQCEALTTLDIIVVPALQVDARGHRLGYGAGYYDRTIPKYAPPAQTIAVAFDFQLVDELPTTPGDVAVDRIVTDTRTIIVQK